MKYNKLTITLDLNDFLWYDYDIDENRIIIKCDYDNKIIIEGNDSHKMYDTIKKLNYWSN